MIGKTSRHQQAIIQFISQHDIDDGNANARVMSI